MTDTQASIGSINISPHAIATIAYQSALQSYGVVGMAPKNIMDGIAQVLVKDPTRGVEIHYNGENLIIDLYIIVEYGTRIKAVTSSIAQTVRYSVEKALGVPVTQVNVHVQGLRVSNTD